MTQWWSFLAVTLTFDSSLIKGEGDSVGCFVLLLPLLPHPVVSRLRGNDGDEVLE